MLKICWQITAIGSAVVSVVSILVSQPIATALPQSTSFQAVTSIRQKILRSSSRISNLSKSNHTLTAADLRFEPIVIDSQFYLPAVVVTTPESPQITRSKSLHPAIVSQAESPAKPNKSQYNLFAPTPRNLLRKFATDRPDTTESPFTVDAGHFQVESEIVSFANRAADEDGNATDNFQFIATNLKVGLLNNVDLQVVVQPYSRSRVRFNSSNQTLQTEGFGAIVTRLKVNLYGNDTFERPGDSALAVMPYISVPTVRDGVGSNFLEGGLIVPFTINLSDKFSLALMTQFDIIKNAESDGHHLEYINTASLGYTVTDRLSSFFEIATRFGNESRFGGVITFDTGLSYDLGEDLQVDAGINVGLTPAADNIRTFVGLSKRF